MDVLNPPCTLIIGGTGSLGKKLIQRWRSKEQIHVYSRDEAKHWTIRQEVENDKNVHFHVGDIRDRGRLLSVIDSVKPHTIIVAAALKQVDTCELTPTESLQTNLEGTRNVIEAVKSCRHSRTSNVLFVSTDKACNPINVYGMCKALSERLITSMGNTHGIRWLCTRYGNVLESRGSIIPLFRYQAEHGTALTVTDPEMTRFMMTLDDAVTLIERTLQNASSGDTWIPIIPSMKIGDLAAIFSEASGKPIRIIGLRPGEKLHEELINESEAVRSNLVTVPRSNGAKCHVIRPSHMVENPGKRFQYTSDTVVMNRTTLKQTLNELGMLTRPLADFDGPRIEEIVTNRDKS